MIRTGKDTGLGHFPSRDYGLNKAWLDASMTACILLSWLRHLALDGKLAKAEPKTLRYRLFHTAARLVRGGRRKTLKIAAILALGHGDHHRLEAYPGPPASHLTSANRPCEQGKEPRGPWNPGRPARQPGYQHAPTPKNRSRSRSSRRSGRRLSSVKDRG